jgi:hypothetical protein
MRLNLSGKLKQAVMTLFKFFMLFICAALLLFGCFDNALKDIALACVFTASAIITLIYGSFSCIKTSIQKTE